MSILTGLLNDLWKMLADWPVGTICGSVIVLCVLVVVSIVTFGPPLAVRSWWYQSKKPIRSKVISIGAMVLVIVALVTVAITLITPMKEAIWGNQNAWTDIKGNWVGISDGDGYSILMDESVKYPEFRVLIHIPIISGTREPANSTAILKRAEASLKREFPGCSIGKPKMLEGKRWRISGIPMVLELEYWPKELK